MKALVFHGKGDLRLQEVPEPECGPGKVKVKPVWCGICGTGEFASSFRWGIWVVLVSFFVGTHDQGGKEEKGRGDHMRGASDCRLVER